MSYLQVASWNIEHLSGASRENQRQSVYALADHVEMAGVDILVMQEVYVTDTDEEVRLAPNQPVIESRAVGSRRNRDIDSVCYLLEEHLDVPWQYRILPNRSSGDKSQLCALMWNSKRVRESNVTRLSVKHTQGDLNLWDRAPHAVTFSSDIKVWRKDADGNWHEQDETKSLCIVPLHMKSNYGGATKNRRVRAEEAKTLCEALDSISDELDPSLLLIGDTNILKYDEPAIETFIDNGFDDLNNNDSATYWSAQYGDSPFDRAFVAVGREEFKYTRQYVLKSSDLVLHDRYLSDHHMIKISVKTYLDDTDPR